MDNKRVCTRTAAQWKEDGRTVKTFKAHGLSFRLIMIHSDSAVVKRVAALFKRALELAGAEIAGQFHCALIAGNEINSPDYRKVKNLFWRVIRARKIDFCLIDVYAKA